MTRLKSIAIATALVCTGSAATQANESDAPGNESQVAQNASHYLDANWQVFANGDSQEAVARHRTSAIANDYFAANWLVTGTSENGERREVSRSRTPTDYFDANWSVYE